jgi:glutaredoxin-like protein
MPETMTLYWRPRCPYCARLKARLRLARIPFRPVNIWEDGEAAAVVRAVNNGNELVPTVRIGDRFLSNPSFGEVRQTLSQV